MAAAAAATTTTTTASFAQPALNSQPAAATPVATKSSQYFATKSQAGRLPQEPSPKTEPAKIYSTQSVVASVPTLIPTASGGMMQIVPQQRTSTMTSVVAAKPTTAATSQPLMLSSSGAVTSLQRQANPIIIPAGNPLLICGTNASATATPTMVPMAAPTAGTLVLQQPVAGQQAGLGLDSNSPVTAQPQVKIITQQGHRLQMQPIQTPSGLQLITVPVAGGSAVVQAAAAAAPQTFQPAMVTLPSVPTMGGLGLPTASHTTILGATSAPMVISAPQQQLFTQTTTTTAAASVVATASAAATSSTSAKKDKKSKKRKKDPLAAATSAVVSSALEDAARKQQQQAAAAAPKSGTVLDLGELMKDVGLDLEGFGGVDEATAVAAVQAATPATSETTSIQFQQKIPTGSIIATGTSLPTNQPQILTSGTQLVNQIQQPLPFQVSRFTSKFATVFLPYFPLVLDNYFINYRFHFGGHTIQNSL